MILHQSLKNALMNGKLDAALDLYQELDVEWLSSELRLRKPGFPDAATLGKASTELMKMVPGTRHLFHQAEVLVRLILLCPMASSDAERGFSESAPCDSSRRGCGAQWDK